MRCRGLSLLRHQADGTLCTARHTVRLRRCFLRCYSPDAPLEPPEPSVIADSDRRALPQSRAAGQRPVWLVARK
jgi:hypothetical protein